MAWPDVQGELEQHFDCALGLSEKLQEVQGSGRKEDQAMGELAQVALSCVNDTEAGSPSRHISFHVLKQVPSLGLFLPL